MKNRLLAAGGFIVMLLGIAMLIRPDLFASSSDALKGTPISGPLGFFLILAGFVAMFLAGLAHFKGPAGIEASTEDPDVPPPLAPPPTPTQSPIPPQQPEERK